MELPTHIVAVGAFVVNAAGQLLLVKHPRRGWEFPGGIVEQGEDLIAALKREVLEETGVTAHISKLVGVYSNIGHGARGGGADAGGLPTIVNFDFCAEAVCGEPRISEEHEDIAWFDREAVLKAMTHPVLIGRMRDYLHFTGNVSYRAYTAAPYSVHHEQSI